MTDDSKFSGVKWATVGCAAFALLLVLVAPAASAQGLATNDPGLAALISARATAEGQVAEGAYAGAISTLLQSLRDADPDRPELADPAYGNGQMVSYVLLHLMPEPAAYAFLAKGFDPAKYETDKLIKTLCTLAIGLYGADKDAQTAEAAYLTDSKNQIVRAIAMFFLSNPYFFENQKAFTDQYVEMLSRDYPSLELTQVSLNFPLYAARETGDISDLAEGTSAKSLTELPYQPWSQSLRARIQVCADNLSVKAQMSRAEAVAPLLDGVTDARDWHERHFSLLLLKRELETDLAAELRDATRQLARHKGNTPDVLQARVLLAGALSADCANAPEDDALREEAVSVAETLLKTGVGETTPERVMWETWAYGIQGCAKNLAAAGHDKDAIALFEALAERIPGSKIANACEEARNELLERDQSQLQNAAE